MDPKGGWELLRSWGARRAGSYNEPSDFYGAARPEETDSENAGEANKTRNWDYELSRDAWQPLSYAEAAPMTDPCLRPGRFVDGKDVGRTVAYVLAPQGFPVPIRLSQIGAIALRALPPDVPGDGYRLRCETRRSEKVVSFMADLFPWDEVERFAAALHANGFRLLISRRATSDDDIRNFAWLNENARYRTREEMFRLERLAIKPCGSEEDRVATLADGRLDDKEEAFVRDEPMIGLVKTHANTTYLHTLGWNTLYALRPGERTPALALDTEKLRLVTWYLRLSAGNGAGPFDGIVRVEIPRPFFEQVAKRDFGYINSLSRVLCESRSRDGGYSRSAITLYPIQRAEEVLGACFAPPDTLTSHFYHIAGL